MFTLSMFTFVPRGTPFPLAVFLIISPCLSFVYLSNERVADPQMIFASNTCRAKELFGSVPGSRDVLLVEIVAETMGTDVTNSSYSRADTTVESKTIDERGSSTERIKARDILFFCIQYRSLFER